jgi:ABC-2 type transport system permease protein
MRPLGARDTIRLVADREVRQRVRSRSFRVGTLVVALLAAGLALLPTLVPGNDERFTVAVVGTAPAPLERVVRDIAAANSTAVTLRRETGGDPAALVRRDDIDAVLADGRRVFIDADAGATLERVVATAAVRARLVAAIDDPAAAQAAARGVERREIGDAGDGTGGLVRFAGVLALFFAIATYGAWVLNSVLEEKSNRVVEIVVATIAPRRLLAGKVIGNGLAGLAQLLVVAAVGVGVAALTGVLADLPSGGLATVVSTIGWFVLGFTFYAVGYAAAGALVSRQEDAQGAVTPMMMIVMTGYLLSLFVVNPAPGGVAARVLWLIPPITPFAMPVRIAAGEVPVWEVALSVVLMVLATWLMIRLAARVYVNALLRTGARVPFRQALRAAPGG